MNPEQKPQNPETTQIVEKLISEARDFMESLTGRAVGKIMSVKGAISDVNLMSDESGIYMEISMKKNVNNVEAYVTIKTKVCDCSNFSNFDGNKFVWEQETDDTRVTLVVYSYDVLKAVKKAIEPVIKSE